MITATTPEHYAPGTVGRPLPNVEVRLADDGEVLARGPASCKATGRTRPTTARAFSRRLAATPAIWANGTTAGNLRIVGRKKEMIVLATGKKVAPTQVEQLLAGLAVDRAGCVVGDGRKCLAALIVPNGDALRRRFAGDGCWCGRSGGP